MRGFIIGKTFQHFESKLGDHAYYNSRNGLFSAQVAEGSFSAVNTPFIYRNVAGNLQEIHLQSINQISFRIRPFVIQPSQKCFSPQTEPGTK